MMDRLRAWLVTSMVGRYGADQFNNFLIGASIVFIVLSMFGSPFFSTLSFVFLMLAVVRMFSRNHSARAVENEKYLSMSEKPREWWRKVNVRWANRKTTAYVKCPSCGKTFTLPKGKGKIRATCPYCHEASVHNV